MKLMVRLFNGFLGATSRLARRPALNSVTSLIMRLLARGTLMIKGGRARQNVAEVGQEWQRMFPSKKMVPIKTIENETVFAEIRAQCPLRATGDVRACYRLMEYDRRMLHSLGGQLIVLQSQAEPGIEVCQVAIRKLDDKRTDLIAAHERDGSINV